MTELPAAEPWLLEVRGLHVHYGKIAAVHGVDLSLRSGELVALIGANGAGKSTTLGAIAGLLPMKQGELHYAGRSLAGVPTHERSRRGVALVPEGRGIFARLTVEENLAMGAYARTDRAAIAADRDRVFTVLPRLRERLHQVAGTLSGGEQQMLAIGRALLSKPRLLLLDEPSMGLAPLFVEKIFEVIQGVLKEGMTILLVEQNAHLALDVADRAYVMDGGLVTLEGTGRELAGNPQVRAAYLGEG